MRRILALLALMTLVSGCICLGGKSLDDVKSMIPGKGKSAESASCESPYIQVGSVCCLDEGSNGICDSEESTGETPTESTETTETTIEEPASTTTTTVTTATTSTQPGQLPPYSLPTTPTTLTQASCSDRTQNQGEEYADCGGPCTDCPVVKLGGGWWQFASSGYKFRYQGKEGSGQSLKYNVEIQVPGGQVDARPMSTGEGFVDNLRFRVVNYGDDVPKIYVRVNTEDMATIPANAVLMTIGGTGCFQGGSAMCERSYGGYRIRMINRVDKGARVQITAPAEGAIPEKVDVLSGKVTFSGDQGLVVGGFFDNTHVMTGGLSLFYVYTR
jgi:hypothetical protein